MGIPTLISTSTASSSSSVVITSGIDGTYDEYMFVCTDIHPATDAEIFGLNLSIDGGSNYNVNKTSTAFQANHTEADGTEFQYEANRDLAEGSGQQCLASGVGNGNDESTSGILHLYSPSNTTFVKHYTATFQTYHASDLSQVYYIAAYENTTSAVNAIQFTMSSGNIDAGTIQMYGIA